MAVAELVAELVEVAEIAAVPVCVTVGDTVCVDVVELEELNTSENVLGVADPLHVLRVRDGIAESVRIGLDV